MISLLSLLLIYQGSFADNSSFQYKLSAGSCLVKESRATELLERTPDFLCRLNEQQKWQRCVRKWASKVRVCPIVGPLQSLNSSLALKPGSSTQSATLQRRTSPRGSAAALF
jgi:hypothetical protein